MRRQRKLPCSLICSRYAATAKHQRRRKREMEFKNIQKGIISLLKKDARLGKATMNDFEKYEFDRLGYIVIPDFLNDA